MNVKRLFFTILCVSSIAGLSFSQERMAVPVIVKNWQTVEAFERESTINVEELPFRSDLMKALKFGVHNLNVQFDRSDNNRPYFYCLRREDGTGEMRHAVHIGIPHVVGRSMLGSQMAFLKTGITFPEEGYNIYKHYCKLSFENDYGLNSYVDTDGKLSVYLHNMREGLWSLWALISAEDSQWAKDQAEKMMLALESITNEDGVWSMEKAHQRNIRVTAGAIADNQARMIDPLLAYYDLTQSPLALKLAGEYAKVGMRDLFDDQGEFTAFKKSTGHIHSITSALSGIVKYAVLQNDTAMISSCKQVMRVGVPEYFSSWGWGDEVMPAHPANVVSQGEINQTGDIVRSAIYLGAAGHIDFYELAERYVRSMLLPAQFWQDDLVGILKENTNPLNDAEKDILERCLGGYGFPLPDARLKSGSYPVETQDITSGAVHALSEFWEHRMTERSGECFLNFLFDIENEDFLIQSSLPDRGVCRITSKSNKSLSVRIPGWVDKESVKLVVDGAIAKPNFDHGYLKVGGPGDWLEAQVSFDIPCKIEKELVDGIPYETTWIGNQLINVNKVGVISSLPF